MAMMPIIGSVGLHTNDLTFSVHSSRQQVPDLAIYFLNGLSYDKKSTVNLVELRKTHLLLINNIS
jgi:hypothetical protein